MWAALHCSSILVCIIITVNILLTAIFTVWLDNVIFIQHKCTDASNVQIFYWTWINKSAVRKSWMIRITKTDTQHINYITYQVQAQSHLPVESVFFTFSLYLLFISLKFACDVLLKWTLEGAQGTFMICRSRKLKNLLTKERSEVIYFHWRECLTNN